MKHAALLSTAPPGLASFTAALPGERSWRVFHQEHRAAYDEVINALEQRQRGICAFCELSLHTDTPTPARQVEHWRPKSLDQTSTTNYTFDVFNFHASCLGGSSAHHKPPFRIGVKDPQSNLSCGQKKEDIDPASLHPAPYRPSDLPITPILFRYGVDGIISPSPDAPTNGYDLDRLQATIDLLGLNCDRLVQARLSIMEDLDARFMVHYEADTSPLEDDRVSRALTEVAKEHTWWDGAPLTRFVTMIRAYVGLSNDNNLFADSNWAIGDTND